VLAAGGPGLSWPQQVLSLAERMRPGSVLDPRCGVRRAFAFDEQPDLELLGRVLTAVVERHDAVRTLPRPEGDGLVQELRPPSPVTVAVASLPPAPAEEETQRAVLAAATAPYDLAAGPLLRGVWLTRPGGGGVLVLGLHHWAGDAAALDALQQETAELYTALCSDRPAPPPPPRYADLAAARGSSPPEHHGELCGWWQRQLAGARRGGLPVTGPGRTPGGGTALLARPLGDEASDALLQLTERHRASPYMVLLAALGALLDDGRAAGELDATVFAVDGGRSAGERRTIGFLAEPLPLRLRLDRTRPLGDAVGSVRATVLAAMAHRDVPFLQLLATAPRLAVALLRGRRPATLVQYFAPSDLALDGLIGRVLPTFPASDVDEPYPWGVPTDLDVTVERRGRSHDVAVLFDPGLWSREDVAAAVDSWETVLRRGLAEPLCPLGRLPGDPR
jgi:hypothetical protein